MFDRAAAIMTLASLGADIEAMNGDGSAPLHDAARSGQVSAIEALVGLGASVNVEEPKSGLTPLHLAANFHHVRAIKALVALGASLEAKDCDGDTPLDGARICSGDATRKREAVAALELLRGTQTDGARK